MRGASNNASGHCFDWRQWRVVSVQRTAVQWNWLNSMHNTATDRRRARLHSKTPPANKSNTPYNSAQKFKVWIGSWAHLAEQYSKSGRMKLQKILEGPANHEILAMQDFLMLPSLWAAALETERRCLSKVILASNVTPI